MCGLFGIYSAHGISDRSAVAEMTSRILHRGPDELFSLDSQFLAAKLARLGMNGIKDGWQPASDRSGRFTSLTNGEIYNAKELYSRLGVPHESNSVDVAVIPEIVSQRGIEGLCLVDGQFASVIYDKEKNTLHLARDRFGICPLYYFTETKTKAVHFCSELKPIVHSLDRQWSVSVTAIDQYFSLGNIVAPTTLVEEISSVPPGCAVRFEKNESPATIRYWRYGKFEPGTVDGDYVKQALHKSVHDRLSADVEIGAYLSGGFDSSTIVALASDSGVRPLKTFSSVFDNPLIDERPFQDEVSRMYSTRHTQVSCTFDETIKHFEPMVRHCCAPQRETYNVAALQLSSAVKASGIKGILSGEGADELFFGYDSYAFDSVGRPPRFDRDENASLWGDAQFSWELDWRTIGDRKKRYFTSDGLARLEGREFWRSRVIPFDDHEVAQLTTMQLRSIVDVYVQMSGHLLGDHGDSMLMANSVEGRYPFLANEVTAIALGVPDEEKVVDFEGKAFLKNTFNPILPTSVANRGKQGFTAPDLREAVSKNEWSRWEELVDSTEILSVFGLAKRPEDARNKWDFGLSAISIAIIMDELKLTSGC